MSPTRPPMEMTQLSNCQIRVIPSGPSSTTWPSKSEASNVTKRYSSGRSSLRHNMPVQSKPKDKSPDVESIHCNDYIVMDLCDEMMAAILPAEHPEIIEAETVLAESTHRSQRATVLSDGSVCSIQSQRSQQSVHSTANRSVHLAASRSTCSACHNTSRISSILLA
jgi:hypothetical protein